MTDNDGCTCTWMSYAKIGGGTGCDIAQEDPECPVHGEGWRDEPPAENDDEGLGEARLAVEEEDRLEAVAAAERIARSEQNETRLRAALEHIASPNQGANPTWQDAVAMASYARQQLQSIYCCAEIGCELDPGHEGAHRRGGTTWNV